MIVNGVPSTSQASAIPARPAISVPISFMVTFSQVFVRWVVVKLLSSGVEIAEMLPETGQPEKLKLSTIKKPHGRIRLSPEYWQFSARIVAARVSPATGIHAPVHRRSRSCSVMSRLSASPLAGSVYEISVTKPEISAVAAVPL